VSPDVLAGYRLWLGDITYVPTGEGWLYLAVLLDAHSRRAIGWAMADHLRTALALEALAMAVRVRRPSAGLVHHTDRGSQYTAAAYQSPLGVRGIVCSKSRSGECLDNAMAERFFATLKAELVAAHRWPTRVAARTAIFAWVEVFYNRQRAHSALAYRPPVTFEEEVLLLSDRAAWRYPVCVSEVTPTALAHPGWTAPGVRVSRFSREARRRQF